MKFGFIIMGDFNIDKDFAKIHNDTAQIIGVSNLDEACTAAKKLYRDGIGCIELCGAFGENGAKEIIIATENKIPIGYVTHLSEQDELFNSAFSN
ncbi:MAG: DUF6506 family protein [Oscillospiraceae bacterium]